MFIFEFIGAMIGNVLKLILLFVAVFLFFTFYHIENDGKSSFSLAIEPVYTEKHKPSGLIIPKHDPRFYEEIQ